MASAPALTYALPILIVVPLLYRRLRKMLKPQELKLGRLWIRPAIYIAVAAGVLLAPTPGAPALAPSMLGWLVLAAALGAVAGWQWAAAPRCTFIRKPAR